MSVKPPAPTLTPDKYRLAVTVNLPMNGDPDPLVCLPEGPVIWLIRNNDGKHGFDVTIDPAKFKPQRQEGTSVPEERQAEHARRAWQLRCHRDDDQERLHTRSLHLRHRRAPDGHR